MNIYLKLELDVEGEEDKGHDGGELEAAAEGHVKEEGQGSGHEGLCGGTGDSRDQWFQVLKTEHLAGRRLRGGE